MMFSQKNVLHEPIEMLYLPFHFTVYTRAVLCEYRQGKLSACIGSWPMNTFDRTSVYPADGIDPLTAC